MSALREGHRLLRLRYDLHISAAWDIFSMKIPVLLGLAFKAFFFNGEAVENRLNFSPTRHPYKFSFRRHPGALQCAALHYAADVFPLAQP